MNKDDWEKRVRIKVSDAIGSVSALVIRPERLDGVLVLAHGAGAGMEHPFMGDLANAFANYNIATVRFNFPFTENRRGRPDSPPVAEKTIASVIDTAQLMFPGTPLFVGGKSFGGRMTSQLLSKECPPFVRGVVFFGFPLHAPGSPSVTRAAHLRSVPVPMYFLQGTRDALAKLELITQVTNQLSKAMLKKYEGADHSFKAGKVVYITELAVDTVQWFNYVNAVR